MRKVYNLGHRTKFRKFSVKGQDSRNVKIGPVSEINEILIQNRCRCTVIENAFHSCYRLWPQSNLRSKTKNRAKKKKKKKKRVPTHV